MKLRFNSKTIQEHEARLREKNARVYISGKISGLVDLNVFKFNQMENRLCFWYGTSLEVINPHNLAHDHDKAWASYMREDLRHMMTCTAIVVLDDWHQSRGSILELLIAHVVAIPVYEFKNQKLQLLTFSFFSRLKLLVKLALKRA